ncbi:MAG: hypothetical protein KAS72_12420 [Phycisphaerales bacterium]|nr:hypothetical protein [Phycisphaerales bacterium]
MNITAAQRRRHLDELRRITDIPTAAGREHRVIAYISAWARSRRNVILDMDGVGNPILSLRRGRSARRAKLLYVVAHMDHPAFVVRKVRSPREIVAEFRGGVRPAYFDDARATFFDADDQPVNAVGVEVRKPRKGSSLFYRLTFRLTRNANLQVGDIGRWRMGKQRITREVLHTPACDNLASVAAALCMLDVLRTVPSSKRMLDVRLLLTRAEEVGFVGTIGACKNRTIPKSARVLVLENSRSFADSPIGGGPIVRIGDRLSTFDPQFTAAIAAVAEELRTRNRSFAWQRKLMAGGMCEATAFQAYGYESACVCLPLGNYHNQGDLANVEMGTNVKPATAANEYISVADFHRFVHLITECARSLGPAPSQRERMEAIYKQRSYVLD